MNEHFIKISKCISSSITKEQFDSCERLVEFFEYRFCKKNKSSSDAKKLLRNLIHKLCTSKVSCNIYN
jgi:hypothetical protein